jgi:hypothetical protein
MFALDNDKEIETISMVIRNFLDYVLHHSVCPEYTADIMAARKLCDVAEKELWAIKQLQRKLPGDFNVAASTLFGGRYQNIHIQNAEWAVEDPNYGEYPTIEQGFGVVEAKHILTTAIAVNGNNEIFLEAIRNPGEIIKTEKRYYEVINIVRSDVQINEPCAGFKNDQGQTGQIKPLGLIHFKLWSGPGLESEDHSDDEEIAALDASGTDSVYEKYWLEDDILAHCFLGMKLELEVHELDIGIRFFDTVHGIYCSFLTILPNEKMANWKEPGIFTKSCK